MPETSPHASPDGQPAGPARRLGRPLSGHARPPRRLTLAEVRKLPATCSVDQGAAALGISRATAYELVAAGEFPARVLTVRRRHRVITSSLLALLEDDARTAGPGKPGAGDVAV
jgi:predicted DNA-binding transcriptional regulator AlpA